MTEDIHYVTTTVVSCDGNGATSSLGHPRIFLNIAKEGKIECPYCSRLFILEAGVTEDAH